MNTNEMKARLADSATQNDDEGLLAILNAVENLLSKGNFLFEGDLVPPANIEVILPEINKLNVAYRAYMGMEIPAND